MARWCWGGSGAKGMMGEGSKEMPTRSSASVSLKSGNVVLPGHDDTMIRL